MLTTWVFLPLLLLSSCVIAGGKDDGDKNDDKSDWVCGNDGFYYQNGVKSQYSCSKSGDGGKDADDKSGDGKDSPCSDMPTAYTQTCITGPPNNVQRCWWTYVPPAVKAESNLTVPLVIDMHGGGGCASDSALGSGFKELSDTLGSESFITVWPQGHTTQWGTCGSDCAAVAAENTGKEIYSTDDLSFLVNMVATIVKGLEDSNPAKGRIDAERVFATGFSMGCMMSHRLALEHSSILAGFGCHGGTLVHPSNAIATTLKTRFDVQPMPVYMTGGSADQWFDMANSVFSLWGSLDSCSATTTTNIALAPAGEYPNAQRSVASGCTPAAVEVVRMEITDEPHIMDSRMAKYMWDFLKSPSYRRLGALSALPAASSLVTPSTAATPAVTTLLSQKVTFSNLDNAAAYVGDVKTTYELGYGKANGLTTTTGTIEYLTGISVYSSAARRKTAVTFVTTIRPTFTGTVPSSATFANSAAIASAISSVISSNSVVGIVAPTSVQTTATPAVISSVTSSSPTSATFSLLSMVVAIVATMHMH